MDRKRGATFASDVAPGPLPDPTSARIPVLAVPNIPIPANQQQPAPPLKQPQPKQQPNKKATPRLRMNPAPVPVTFLDPTTVKEPTRPSIFSADKSLFKESNPPLSPLFLHNLPTIQTRLMALDTGRYLHLPETDFLISQPPPHNLPSFVATLAVQEGLKDAKYFHECIHDDKRDARFGPKALCTPASATPDAWVHDLPTVHESLVALLSAWSEFTQREEIRWWISHGEMLGWFWNGRFLPWDVDLDIQMSAYELIQLIRYNQTMIGDRFLVDVNPNAVVRSPQKNNIIDARVIDAQTGYFMDITGLTKRGARYLSCKTPHSYFLEDLMPLVETVLEGVKVWRPRGVLKMLKNEYREKALVEEGYKVPGEEVRYVFERVRREWVRVG
ncbi:hypothetical protein HDU98_010022 [Podochytrium sp. JEL0797]|nr:hypothetical protein HDU98_010022 [Podochytrium sp. JEL0797]